MWVQCITVCFPGSQLRVRSSLCNKTLKTFKNLKKPENFLHISLFSGLEVNFNVMRCINLRFTYFTYLLTLLSFFSITCNVNFSAYNQNYILDLVITSSDTSFTPSLSVSHCSPSDHFPIFTNLSVAPTPLPPPAPYSLRRLHSIDIDSVSDLKSSDLIGPN